VIAMSFGNELGTERLMSCYVEGTDGAVAVETGMTHERVPPLVDLHGDITASMQIAEGTTLLRRSSARARLPRRM